MLGRLKLTLLSALFVSLAPHCGPAPCQAQPAKSVSKIGAALDPSVIDPVGKLAEISNSVRQSSDELTSISKELDKLTDELSKVEKGRPGKVTRASFQTLQKRFNDTIAKSYVVEKKVRDSLTKSQADIENVRKALKAIQVERQTGGARKQVMTDAEISECLKDLDDESATIKALQQSLNDDQAKPSGAGAQVADKNNSHK